MESVYNLNYQNSNLDYKIVAGLDRISQVFKTLLLDKSKRYNLSPIQIQVLIFIAYHSSEKTTVSYLSNEFNLSKPTLSDTIKTLEQKQYIKKNSDQNDTRSYTIELTESGRQIVFETENFVNPLTEIISNTDYHDKLVLWQNITNIIQQLNELKVISIQRTCVKCKFYSENNKESFCSLLNKNLKNDSLRIDCEEFEIKK